MSQRSRPEERLRRRPEFQCVYDRGTKLHGRFMTLFILPTRLDVSRFGVAATRKLGGAVRRNRAKRLAREVFRRNKPTAALDLIVVPKREFLEASLPMLEAEYRSMLRRHGQRSLAARGGSNGR